MMAAIWTLVAAVSVCLQGILGQGTIQDILRKRPELEQFREFASNTDIFAAFGQTNVRFTVFAPNNMAMRQLSPALINEYTGSSTRAKEKKEQLLTYHTVPGTVLMAKDLTNRRVETSARDAPKIFLRSYTVGTEKRRYVNGAQFESEDIVAVNGVVHIIKSVLHPIASKKNALALIEDSAQVTEQTRSARTFFNMLDKVRWTSRSPYQDLNSDKIFVTVFVPYEASIAKAMTNQRYADFEKDEDEVINLLNRHIIVHDSTSENTEEGVSSVWHGSLLNDAIDHAVLTNTQAAITAKRGVIKPVRISNTLYVTNECGMVKVMDLPVPVLEEGEENNGRYRIQPPTYSSGFPVSANHTVNNGVIHFVDGLLGYIYNDAIDMLQEDEEISKFKDHVLMSTSFVDRLTVSGQNIVQDSNKLTIFAPLNAAFVNLEAAGNIDLTQDTDQREKLLNMHMMQGVLNLVDIHNDTRKQTLEDGVSARFYTDRTGTYVEVDRVRARIVKADVCVKNGIIHYIDNLLGMPYRNIMDEIRQKEMLSELNVAVDVTPQFLEGNRDGLVTLKSILESTDSELTIFAPNNDAFRKMRLTAIGQRFFDDQIKLYYLLLIHVARGQFFIDDTNQGRQDVPNSQGLSVFKDNGDYYVQYRSGSDVVQAKVLQENIRLTNGVMHVIDEVLYVNNLEGFEMVGKASSAIPSFSLLLACVLKYFL